MTCMGPDRRSGASSDRCRKNVGEIIVADRPARFELKLNSLSRRQADKYASRIVVDGSLHCFIRFTPVLHTRNTEPAIYRRMKS